MSVVAECVIAFIFGSVVGLLVQRSRFCNTAALRDAILFNSFRNTKALLAAMMILTIGFTLFISLDAGNPMRFDVGLNQVIGLFLFGIGMVLAGACTVSTWVKSGEGNVGAMWALLFTFIGMFLFSLVWSANFWPPAAASMTGAPNLEALQLGYANAKTLQDKFGIPAVFFGIIQGRRPLCHLPGHPQERAGPGSGTTGKSGDGCHRPRRRARPSGGAIV